MSRVAPVGKMQLRRLDEAAQPVARPRRQGPDQEKALEDSHILLCRHARQTESGAETGMVDELTCVLRQNREKPRQTIELIDIGDIPDVPIENLGHIVFEPGGAARPARSPQGLRISAAEDERDQFVAEHHIARNRQVITCV